MAVFRKEHLAPYLHEIESYYDALRAALAGEPPNSNIAHRYQVEPDQFEREFREVDIDRVLCQVEHFKAAVGYLKTLKKAAQTPVKE